MGVLERHKRNIVKAYAVGLDGRLSSRNASKFSSSRHPVHPLLARGNVVDRSPTYQIRNGMGIFNYENILEEKNVGFWFVYFIMLPAETLRQIVSQDLTVDEFLPLTCVIPNARHSSSHKSFSVPLEGSW